MYDEQLEKYELLCIEQHIILTKNIWIEVGHTDGAIGEITDIVYKMGTKPPNMPMYVVIHFENYNGPPWNQDELAELKG